MATANPSVYESLGVRSFINASNNATVFGGSVMPTEVVEAMAQASTEFVELAGLHAAAGRKIAETVGAEAAHVSNGACNGCALAIAACITGDEMERAQRLPDTSGAKNEVVCYRHAPFPNYLYQAIEMIGGKLVKVGEPDSLSSSDFEDAIGADDGGNLLRRSLQRTGGELCRRRPRFSPGRDRGSPTRRCATCRRCGRRATADKQFPPIP